MKTKLLMTLSSLFMAALGLGASFLPDEIIAYTGGPASSIVSLLVQLTGALYLGFAALNWIAKESVLGGIYGRPIVLGNFGHFTIGAITLLKGALVGQDPGAIGLSVVYAGFATWFAATLFSSPIKRTTATD